MIKFILSILLFFSTSAQTAQALPSTVERPKKLALEIGHYINGDWQKDNEQIRQIKMSAFLGELDSISGETGMTPRKWSKFFEATLFDGWSEAELEQEVFDQMGIIDMLYEISSLYLEEYMYSAPLSDEKQLLTILSGDGGIKFLIALAVLAREKKTKEFILLFNDGPSVRNEREKVLSEAFIRGSNGGVSGLRLGGASLFSIFFYVAD